MSWDEPIHRSLHRPPLVLGGDRELVMFSGLGAFLVGLGGFSLLSALCGLAFWLLALHWLRKWGKEDPYLCRVFLRFLKYRDRYSAKSAVWRKPKGKSHWSKKHA